MKQEFTMGQFLKKRYVNDNKLLNQTYLRKQVNFFYLKENGSRNFIRLIWKTFKNNV